MLLHLTMCHTSFCRFLSLHLALHILCGVTSTHVFYRCRDKEIQYYGSKFVFNCSNPNEVIYVESAIIGFTPMYKADNGVFECPITADTCTNAITEPSTLCDGHNECTLAQRILLYSESGSQCNLLNDTALGRNLGGNFININYSCISQDLCSPLAGYNRRYTCSTPTTSTSVASIYSFSLTEKNIATSENFNHLNTHGGDATRFSSGAASNASDTLGARSLSPQKPIVVDDSTQPLPTVLSKKSQLGAGATAGILVAAVVTVAAIIGLAVYALRKRKKRKREANNNPQPRAEDLTDTPQGDRFSHQPQPHFSFAGSLNEVQTDDTAYEKLNRPNELPQVYYNEASPDNNYQGLQFTN